MPFQSPVVNTVAPKMGVLQDTSGVSFFAPIFGRGTAEVPAEADRFRCCFRGIFVPFSERATILKGEMNYDCIFFA